MSKHYLFTIFAICMLQTEFGRKLHAAERKVADYQQKLDSYYKKIHTIKVKYTQTQVQNLDTDFSREVAEFAAKELQETTKNQRNPGRNAIILPAPPLEHNEQVQVYYDLAEKFPSIIQTKHSHLMVGSEEKMEFITKALLNNKQYQLSSHTKTMYETNKIDLNLFDRSLINAIGKRLFHSINQPLSDLLRSADAMIVAGEEEGIEVIRAGPDFSAGTRPSGLPEGAFVLLHVTKNEPFRPVKIIFDMNYMKKKDPNLWPNDNFNEEYELGDFRQIPLNDGGGSMSFPYHARFRNISAVTEWQVSDIGLNLNLPDSVFMPIVPRDYRVSGRGKNRPSIIPGGIRARESIAQRTAKQAQRLLDRGIPSASTSTSKWPILEIITSSAVIIVLVTFILRRRS